MIGRTIHHYEIISKIGEGGMGVVYKAHDQKLDRPVALKFLPPHLAADETTKKRFMHEARAASALDHPNISTVHEINETPDGRLFIVMPCYDGETLRERLERGPLELSEALKIAVQVANGLARAHERGVIHRDVKPGNIMLCSDGQAKIMDFGLAKIAGASRVTQTGMTVGTVAYMSPEQTQGRDIDHRSDVWALGVVLYEMLTGKAPFQSEHQAAIVFSILNTEPEPLSSVQTAVPFEVEQLVSKAMEKDPERRFQTASEMADELEILREKLDLLPKRSELKKRIIRQRRRLALTAVAAVVALALAALAAWYFWPGRAEVIDSIAVLPFVNLSGDEAQDMWADVVTAELISKLGRVSEFQRVTSRSTAMRYKGTQKLQSEIAEELGVKVILSGTLQKFDTRINITAELIDGKTEAVIWSNSFHPRTRHILTLQSDIAQAIVQAIGLELTPEESDRLAAERTVDPEAFDAYSKGQRILSVGGWGDWDMLLRAISFYEQAIAVDSTFARAYAGLANVTSSMCRWWARGKELCEPARAAATKAIELDESLAEAHAAMGRIYLEVDFDWESADKEHRRAVELNPRSVEALINYSEYLLWAGEFEQSIDALKRALEIDPVSQRASQRLGFAYFCSRRYDAAIKQIQEHMELYPEDPFAKPQLAWCYIFAGMTDKYEEAIALYGGEPFDDGLYALMGQRDKALAAIARHKETGVQYYEAARVYAGLGETDSAMVYLEIAQEKTPHDLLQINTDAEFDKLRPDPRFQDLMSRAGIPAGELELLSR